MVEAGPPFGALPLVDEIDCGAPPPDKHPFVEVPAGASRVESILGRRSRVLPNEGSARYFAYRIGQGSNLKPGAAYVLTVEYPEDRPRTLFILNRGAEMARGISTGAALGDVLYSYTNNNAESLRYPLSGKYRTWKAFFHLHDRFPDLSQPRGNGPRPMLPKDGFWVIIAQSEAAERSAVRWGSGFAHTAVRGSGPGQVLRQAEPAASRPATAARVLARGDVRRRRRQPQTRRARAAK
jgi:hypothetical protein